MNRCMTYICDVCKEKLFTKERQDYVYCRVYSLGYSFMCVECSKIFSMAFEVTKKKQPQYACERCDKVFKTHRGMASHSYEHSNDWPCVCEECGKGFAIQSKLIEHKNTRHSDEKPYKCTFCLSTFKAKGNLTQHLLKHDEKNPFTCEECNKRCQSQSHLDTHMLKHSDIKLYKCDFCSTECRYKNTLVSHMDKFHHKSL